MLLSLLIRMSKFPHNLCISTQAWLKCLHFNVILEEISWQLQHLIFKIELYYWWSRGSSCYKSFRRTQTCQTWKEFGDLGLKSNNVYWKNPLYMYYKASSFNNLEPCVLCGVWFQYVNHIKTTSYGHLYHPNSFPLHVVNVGNF